VRLRSARWWLLLFCALTGCHNGHQRPVPPDAGPAQPELQFLFVPAREKTAGPAPVLVLLHGVGSNEHDLLGLEPSLDPRFALYSLRAPLPLGPQSFAWFHLTPGLQHDPAEAEAARTSLVRFLRTLRQNPEIDPSRIYLLGFSQGAILSLSVLLTEPELVSGAVVISGLTLPEIAERAKASASLAAPHVLLMHGRQDARLPFARAIESQAVLQRSGFSPELKAYDAGHEINAAMRDDLGKWLMAELSPPR
jgi:phospholipase/carboxylesterase